MVNSHTDGVTWVQENGPIGVLALARYLGGLPRACRHRDVEFALTSDHLGFTNDGTFRYADELDQDFDQGTVAFVLSMEHLGSREILPTGPNHRLRVHRTRASRSCGRRPRRARRWCRRRSTRCSGASSTSSRS